jgi:23S rRNA (pseudouridine1915-N3)-methyltransferase
VKVRVLFPHRIKSEPIRELVHHSLTLAGHTLSPELTISPFVDRKGRVPTRLLEQVRDSDSIFLSERGKTVRSEWFRGALEDAAMNGKPVLFIVGDAFGIPPELEAVCKRRISLTALTLPHELALALLTEQLWRAASMISGHPYHK